MPRGVPGSGTTIPHTRSGTQAAATLKVAAEQTIWQGASLDGQYIFRLTRSGVVWRLYHAFLGTATTLTFKPVTTIEICLLAFAAMGTQYAALFVPGVGMLAANRSVARTTDNAIPKVAAHADGVSSTATQRIRKRISGSRTPAAAGA